MWPGLFLLYVIVEVSALVALTSTVGIGWTILAVAGAFVIGLVLAGSQARRALGQLRRGGRSPGGAIADGALIALGTIAVVIPGLVSSTSDCCCFCRRPVRCCGRSWHSSRHGS